MAEAGKRPMIDSCTGFYTVSLSAARNRSPDTRIPSQINHEGKSVSFAALALSETWILDFAGQKFPQPVHRH
jgi:hypothetical protein